MTKTTTKYKTTIHVSPMHGVVSTEKMIFDDYFVGQGKQLVTNEYRSHRTLLRIFLDGVVQLSFRFGDIFTNYLGYYFWTKVKHFVPVCNPYCHCVFHLVFRTIKILHQKTVF